MATPVGTTIGVAATRGNKASRDLLEHLVLDVRQMRELAKAPWVFERGRI